MAASLMSSLVHERAHQILSSICVCSQEQIPELVHGCLAEREPRVKQAGVEMLQTWLQERCDGSIVSLVAELRACSLGKPAIALQLCNLPTCNRPCLQPHVA